MTLQRAEYGPSTRISTLSPDQWTNINNQKVTLRGRKISQLPHQKLGKQTRKRSADTINNFKIGHHYKTFQSQIRIKAFAQVKVAISLCITRYFEQTLNGNTEWRGLKNKC